MLGPLYNSNIKKGGGEVSFAGEDLRVGICFRLALGADKGKLPNSSAGGVCCC